MELLRDDVENAIRSAFAFTIKSSAHAVYAAMQGLKSDVNMVESGTPVMIAPPFSAMWTDVIDNFEQLEALKI